jgi:hypothetical protein
VSFEPESQPCNRASTSPIKMRLSHLAITATGCPTPYVIRKTVDADNTEEHCYFCFVDWQIGDGMVRLRCCSHWLHEDCLSKSVLDGRCPTCGIWLASLDDAQVLAGAASVGDVLKVRELLEKHTSCTTPDYYGRTPSHSAVLGTKR